METKGFILDLFPDVTAYHGIKVGPTTIAEVGLTCAATRKGHLWKSLVRQVWSLRQLSVASAPVPDDAE